MPFLKSITQRTTPRRLTAIFPVVAASHFLGGCASLEARNCFSSEKPLTVNAVSGEKFEFLVKGIPTPSQMQAIEKDLSKRAPCVLRRFANGVDKTARHGGQKVEILVAPDHLFDALAPHYEGGTTEAFFFNDGRVLLRGSSSGPKFQWNLCHELEHAEENYLVPSDNIQRFIGNAVAKHYRRQIEKVADELSPEAKKLYAYTIAYRCGEKTKSETDRSAPKISSEVFIEILSITERCENFFNQYAYCGDRVASPESKSLAHREYWAESLTAYDMGGESREKLEKIDPILCQAFKCYRDGLNADRPIEDICRDIVAILDPVEPKD